MDEEGDIVQIVNNYANMSFNFGPTLLAWMEKNSPSLYEAILEADAQSREHFSGRGSAIAQAYNHMILPLANRRDKKTQVIWRIWDYDGPIFRAVGFEMLLIKARRSPAGLSEDFQMNAPGTR